MIDLEKNENYVFMGMFIFYMGLGFMEQYLTN